MDSDGNELEDVPTMTGLLHRWARNHFGWSDVDDVVRLPGHSGITFSFRVCADGEPVERLVIKVPPLGVPLRGSMDVLRQVPVLRLMAREGVRVPAVRSSGPADDEPFPVPHLIVDHVPGQTLGDIFAGPLKVSGASALAQFDQAIAELVAIHSVPPDAGLPSVRDLFGEIDHWVPVLQKAQDEAWVDRGMEVRRRLLDTMPSDHRTGVVHGDYYSNNWLFDDGVLTAVLDWENATIGAGARRRLAVHDAR